jgi:hypothetical protein
MPAPEQTLDIILDDLADEKIWVTWQTETRNNNKTQVPNYAQFHGAGSTDDPSTWGTRERAAATARRLQQQRAQQQQPSSTPEQEKPRRSINGLRNRLQMRKGAAEFESLCSGDDTKQAVPIDTNGKYLRPGQAQLADALGWLKQEDVDHIMWCLDLAHDPVLQVVAEEITGHQRGGRDADRDRQEMRDGNPDDRGTGGIAAKPQTAHSKSVAVTKNQLIAVLEKMED